ncbi:MAG: DUF927 domain-containing protein [Candidatus Obscuribacterales bacterium]
METPYEDTAHGVQPGAVQKSNVQYNDIDFDQSAQTRTNTGVIGVTGVTSKQADNTGITPNSGTGVTGVMLDDTPQRQAARLYTSNGLGVIPVWRKRFAYSSKWSPYQRTIADEQTQNLWFKTDQKRGVAIVCGAVSGGLVVVDIDDPLVVSELDDKLRAAGLALPYVKVSTPKSGRHIYFRVEGQTGGAEKWAMTASKKVRIETRAEGSYVMAPGSSLDSHSEEATAEYTHIDGDWSQIPLLSFEQYKEFESICRSFDARPASQAAPLNVVQSTDEPGGRPGDDYESKVAWSEVLTPHGWILAGQKGDKEEWQRPGNTGKPGCSATVNYQGNDRLYVFSTNAYPFEEGKSYSRFQAYALLNHAGDHKQAAKVLRKQGYGKQQNSFEASAFVSDKSKQAQNSGFQITDGGVIYDDGDGKHVWVCSKLEVLAKVRDTESKNWGRVLKFTDDAGQSKTWCMPMSMLSGDGNELRQVLLSYGLIIAPGSEARKLLSTYLQTACAGGQLATCVSKLGWHDDSFVLPSAAIGDTGIFFQTESEVRHGMSNLGSLEEWIDNVSLKCAGNSRLMTAVSLAFAAPVLDLLNEESGGIHFRGASSTGKTTALLVGGSVWGPKSFVKSWRSTDNGMESTAALHNDLPLFLDEISQVDPAKAGEIAYMLANGQTKQRANRSGLARNTATFRTLFLSTGEVSLAAVMGGAGKKLNAGQELRVIDIPADAGRGLGIFEDLHGIENGDLFARQLKDSVAHYHGTAGLEFLTRLTAHRKESEVQLRTLRDAFVESNVGPGASGQVLRVAGRLAAIAAAGELATSFGLTGWQPGAATEAVQKCYDDWLLNRGGDGALEPRAMIAQVRLFIEQHDSRFVKWDEAGDGVEDRVAVNRAGFKRMVNGELTYYVFSETFKSELCKGLDSRTVARLLIEKGYLKPDNVGKSSRTESLPNLGSTRVYVLASKILNDDADG